MDELFSGWRFIPQRVMSSWRLLSVTAVGVLVAAALLAAVPLYSTALSDLGLQFRLGRALEETRLNTIEVGNLFPGDARDIAKRDAVNAIFDARVGWLGPERLVEERSSRLLLDFEPPALGLSDEPSAAADADGEESAAADADGEESAAGDADGEESAAADADGEESAAADADGEESAAVDSDGEESASADADGEESAVPERAWNAFLYLLSNFERDVVVTEGRLPGPADGPAEVVLPDGFQQHAAVGESVYFALRRFNDCVAIARSDDPNVRRQEVRCQPSILVSSSISATITGFVRPKDPDDPRWEIFSGTFEVPEEALLPHVDASLAFDPFGGGANMEVIAALNGEGSMPLLTTAEQLFGSFSVAAPHLPMRYTVGIVASVRDLTLGDVERGIQGSQLVRTDIGERLGLVPVMQWPVGKTLDDFRSTQTFQQIPLLIILLQVVGIVLYYVAVVSSMLVEREAEELSVLRSRGASTAQVVGLYLMEGVLLASVATAIAPWIAGQGVAALGYTPTFRAMTDGTALPVSVAPSAYLLAATGAVLAMLALMIPAFAVARRAIVDAKREQARPPGRSVIQRYYLDLAVVGLAGVLLWQLGQRGTVFDRDAIGGWTSDPLLLASPLIFTAAVAALVLRLYPPLLRRSVAVLLTAGGTAVAIGLRRTARSPAAYARLMLLLVMAISVGTFAASYGPTVDRSQNDRVRYSTGVGLRGTVQESQTVTADERIEAVRALDGVDAAALAFRGSVGTPTRNTVQLLAIDPRRAESMIWFRDDFADESLPEIMRAIQSDVPSGGGIPLQQDTTELRIAMLATTLRLNSTIWARFHDADGGYSITRVGKVDFDGWRELTIALPDQAPRPLSFAGLRITEPRGSAVPRKGAIYFDTLTAVLAGGEQQVIEDFERDSDRLGWTVHGGATSADTIEISSEQSATGNRAAKWSWPLGQASGLRYLVIDDPNAPLAVIVNPAAVAALGFEPDEAARMAREGTPIVGRVVMQDIVVPVRMVVVAEMFPTLLPETPFMVVNLEHMREVAGLLDRPAFRQPNELWISSSAGLAGQDQLVATLLDIESPLRLVGDIRIQAAELSVVRADPTLQASGSGILIAAFSAVLGLAMLGFVVSLVLGARARVVEFAVLRAVGTSRLQVLRSMVLEWGVVLAIGAVIGVLLGRQLARVMLSFLNVTEDGLTVVPPFTVETDWLILGAGVGALAAVAAAGLMIAWALSVRRDTTIELRLTR